MPTEGSGSVELTAAVQDYAKAIYALETRVGVASTNALAERLGVRPASVSGMLRKLDALALVKHERYRGVHLTESGLKVALEVLRHHRLLELYLAEGLGMGWDEVHADAERLEHVLSEELEDVIAAKLGYPSVDPHGDPIPTATLEIEGLEGDQTPRAITRWSESPRRCWLPPKTKGGPPLAAPRRSRSRSRCTSGPNRPRVTDRNRGSNWQ